MVLSFPAKAVSKIMDEEQRETGKRNLAVERFLAGCTKETLAFFNKNVEFEELGWRSFVCKKGDIPSKVWVIYKGSLAAVQNDLQTTNQKDLPLSVQNKQINSKVVKVFGPELCLGLLESKFRRPMKYDIQTHESNTVIFWIDAASLWETTLKEFQLGRTLKLKGLQFSMAMTKGIKDPILMTMRNNHDTKFDLDINMNHGKIDSSLELDQFNKTNFKNEAEKSVKPKSRGMMLLQRLFNQRKNVLTLKTENLQTKDNLEIPHSSYSTQNLAWFSNISRRY